MKFIAKMIFDMVRRRRRMPYKELVVELLRKTNENKIIPWYELDASQLAVLLKDDVNRISKKMIKEEQEERDTLISSSIRTIIDN